MANEAVTVVAGAGRAPRARLSEGALIVALMAALSTLLIAKIWISRLPPQVSEIPPLEIVGPSLALHILVVLLVALQFNRVADVFAFLVGAGALYFAALYATRTRQPLFVVLAVVQFVMLVAAAYDLWSSRRRPRYPVPASHRALGVLAAVVIGVAAVAMVGSGRAAQAKERLAAETRAAAERQMPRNAWMQQSVLPKLYELARCIELARGDSMAGPYPRTLADAPSCASGDAHHRFYYTPPTAAPDPWRASGFVLESQAVWDTVDNRLAAGTPGARNYLIDSAGDVHVTVERRRATASDSLLPRCTDGAVPTDCAAIFLPRQRWGVRPRLPRVAIAMGEQDLLGQETTLTLIFQAADVTDTLASLAISWTENGPFVPVPLPRQPTTRRRPAPWNPVVSVSLEHTYPDTGLEVVRAAATLRSRERYETRDTVRIVARR